MSGETRRLLWGMLRMETFSDNDKLFMSELSRFGENILNILSFQGVPDDEKTFY